MTRKEQSALFIREHQALLSCPICRKEMTISKLASLACSNNHTFDVAKQGYVNMVTRPVKSNYDKDLFKARHEIIMTSQLYDSLHHRISKVLNENIMDTSNHNYIFDAGAGEGSHLVKILNQLTNHLTGVGIDLSKEGIRLAASTHQAIWFVADLANIPVKNKSFQVILNILSPANYQEFDRVLADDGIMIKVVPGSNYLKELRTVLFSKEEKATYNNDKTVSLFKEKYPVVEIENVTYTRQLTRHELEHFIQMTPLAWNMDRNQIMKLWDKDYTDITFDLDLLIGKNK